MSSKRAVQGADLDAWIAKVRQCEYLPENDLKLLCQMVGEPYDTNADLLACYVEGLYQACAHNRHKNCTSISLYPHCGFPTFASIWARFCPASHLFNVVLFMIRCAICWRRRATCSLSPHLWRFVVIYTGRCEKYADPAITSSDLWKPPGIVPVWARVLKLNRHIHSAWLHSCTERRLMHHELSWPFAPHAQLLVWGEKGCGKQQRKSWSTNSILFSFAFASSMTFWSFLKSERKSQGHRTSSWYAQHFPCLYIQLMGIQVSWRVSVLAGGLCRQRIQQRWNLYYTHAPESKVCPPKAFHSSS